MKKCLQRLKQRCRVWVKWVYKVAEGSWRDTVSCEHWAELLSILVAEEEKFPKLILLKEIEDDIQMDELEEDTVEMMNYHDVILSLQSPCNEDDWQRVHNSEWAELALA